jgi:hypothetical protein
MAWLGPAPYRDYHDGLHPHDWHSWRDFGNGSIGNMGCHIINHAYWALRLARPEAVELEAVNGGGDDYWPAGARIRWEFPARDGLAPLNLYWHDGLAKGKPYNEKTVPGVYKHVIPEAWNLPPIRAELEQTYDRELPERARCSSATKASWSWAATRTAAACCPKRRTAPSRVRPGPCRA